MTEPRDEIDGWLEAPVEPLPPPPGTYERIRRRARRRKRNKALATAATAAAVLAGLIAIPRLTALLPGRANPESSIGGVQSPSPSRPSPHNVLSASPTETGTGQPVPNGFAAMSATFVGLRTGWALGTSTTHYGTPSAQCRAAGADCLQLARTDNAGTSWYSVPAPPTTLASDGTGVSQVRFLNRDVGWVFGPQLWWTRDGGQHWQQVDTGGERVVSLEAVGDRAFAVFARCTSGATSTPAGSSAGCYAYRLYSAAAGTGTWRPVPGATSGAGGTATVVLARDTGYLLASGTGTEQLSRGPVSAAAAWSAVAAPCPVGQPAPTPAGAPYQGTLLATTSTDQQLFAVCNAGAQPSAGSTATEPAAQAKEIVVSADGGRTWAERALAQIAGTALSAAATPDGGSVFIATTKGLYGSTDSGTTWRLIMTGPDGGFGYVGMTDNLQGFAIPAALGQHGILFTMDGGQSWQRSMVSGPG